MVYALECFNYLLRHLGTPLLVIWVRSPIHRMGAVKEFITVAGEKHLVVERLPAYAPDRNPVEWLWERLKYVELQNLACMDLEELHIEFYMASARVCQRLALIHSFFEEAQLSLKNALGWQCDNQ
jgi:DDE superfamily endonuclease